MFETREHRGVLTGLAAALTAGLGLLAWWQQRVPEGGVAGAQARAWERRLEASRRVDVNTAGVAELERLPGVGPTLAGRIVAEREAHGPFAGTAALRRVRGLGPKTLEMIQEYVAVVDGRELNGT